VLDAVVSVDTVVSVVVSMDNVVSPDARVDDCVDGDVDTVVVVFIVEGDTVVV
jgi:hypothetical protein